VCSIRFPSQSERQFMSVIILMADRVLDSSRHKEVMNAKQRHLVAPEMVRFLG
jgi:hypothetical protein